MFNPPFLLDFISQIIFGTEHTWWRSSLYNVLHHQLFLLIGPKFTSLPLLPLYGVITKISMQLSISKHISEHYPYWRKLKNSKALHTHTERANRNYNTTTCKACGDIPVLAVKTHLRILTKLFCQNWLHKCSAHGPRFQNQVCLEQ